MATESTALGKAQTSDEPSQENCLFDIRRVPRMRCIRTTYLRATGRGFVAMCSRGFLVLAGKPLFIYILWEEFG